MNYIYETVNFENQEKLHLHVQVIFSEKLQNIHNTVNDFYQWRKEHGIQFFELSYLNWTQSSEYCSQTWWRMEELIHSKFRGQPNLVPPHCSLGSSRTHSLAINQNLPVIWMFKHIFLVSNLCIVTCTNNFVSVISTSESIHCIFRVTNKVKKRWHKSSLTFFIAINLLI